MHKTLIIFCGMAVVSVPVATSALARSNILTGGVTTTYDYQNRDSDNSTLTNSADDDFSSLSLTPFLQLISSTERDSLELRAAPGIKYDLEESETDMDYDLSAFFDRDMTRAWHFTIGNTFLQTDQQSSGGAVISADDSGEVSEPVEPTEPELSSDLGRRRYWRNSFEIGSDYTYRKDSLVHAGFDWIVLRNDDNGEGYDDYDRYSFTLGNEHRYTAAWKTNVGFNAVYGDYDENKAEEELSEDLWEYYFDAGLENNMIQHNPLSLTYSYIATRYEESQQSDSDIHQMRLNWRRDFSPHFYTNVGAGPSYYEIEDQDDTWGANGIIEANYQVRRGSYYFALEKDYDVDNFSGTDERGVVDTWSATFSFNRQLSRYFSMNGNLGYRYEDRPTSVVGSGGSNASAATEEINEEQYRAGLGISYTFWQHYTASADYTFTTQKSDRDENDYDDHRIVLSLSWQQDLMRW